MTAKTSNGNGSMGKVESQLYDETVNFTPENVSASKAQARSIWEEIGKAAVGAVKTIASVPEREGVYARGSDYVIGTLKNQYCSTKLHEYGHNFETDEYRNESKAKKVSSYLKDDHDADVRDFAESAYKGFEEIEEATGVKLHYDGEIDAKELEVYRNVASGKLGAEEMEQDDLKYITGKDEFVYGANDNGKIYIDSNLSKAWKQWKGFSLN